MFANCERKCTTDFVAQSPLWLCVTRLRRKINLMKLWKEEIELEKLLHETSPGPLKIKNLENLLYYLLYF